MISSPIRVLVVDDSAYIRKVMTEILERSSQIKVVGTAMDGFDALEKTAELKPDVITLDLFMPNMDGVGFIEAQMARQPLPIVVCSVAGEGEEKLIAAFEAGAVEFVHKPTFRANEQVYTMASDVVDKVVAAAGVSIDKLPKPVKATEPPSFPGMPIGIRGGLHDAVVIGLSTGGPQALRYILPSLPGSFPAAMAVVVHMPVSFTGPLAARLNELSEVEVLEAEEGLEMRPGRVILGQAGFHLILNTLPDGRVVVHLDVEPITEVHRPSVDVLFRSAAEVYGSRLLGIVMTGMGSDGLQGTAWIKSQGGTIFTESEETSVVYGMPRSVNEAGLSDKIVCLEDMPRAILEAL